MLLVLVVCAVALAAVANEPTSSPPRSSGKHDPNRWSHLPSGGGDYSLGANYGPLFKGKVGGAAQDVDNDNNNNDNNDNNNNDNDNAPASVMGDMNDIDIYDEITNVNLNFNSNPDINSNGNVFESSNTKVEQLPTPHFWTPDQITALVTSVIKNLPGATEKNVHVKVNGEHVDTSEAFERRAKALAELRKAGPIQPVSTVQAIPAPAPQHKRKQQLHGLKRRFRALRAHRRQLRPATAAQKKKRDTAEVPQHQNVGPAPGQENMGGGGGGVYNVESNFAPKFKDDVAGNRQADDNDNNNNANNDNNNNDNSNDNVQVSGSGNKLRYHVKDRNININLNMNYFGNANHNAGPEKAKAAK